MGNNTTINNNTMSNTNLDWLTKPVKIQAMQWDGTAEGAFDIFEELPLCRGQVSLIQVFFGGRNESNDSELRAYDGDWIVVNASEAVTVVSDEVFRATYERADA